MSISGTLSSALSGLTAAARAAEVVSSNIANVGTPGYGRRELLTQSRAVGQSGQGVDVVGVARRVNQPLLADRRLSQSASSSADAREAFLRGIEERIGTGEGSLNDQVARFATSLTAAASRPDAEARLAEVLSGAKRIVGQINGVAGALRSARSQADAAIAADVRLVNDALTAIADLNGRIRTAIGTGQDASALIDLRQARIDAIAPIIPLREVDRDFGQVALFTTGGAILLDGAAGQLGFQPAGLVTEDMAIGGALSGLTLNGQPLPMSASQNVISGGRMAENFQIRDSLAPAAGQRLDAMARDLIERFADPALDPSLAPGAPGLFTDAGGPFNAAQETGLSLRLAVNAAVDPARGGGLWRLRDGIGAAAPGATGNPALINRLAARLDAARVTVSGGYSNGPRSFGQLASDFASGVAQDRLAAQDAARFASARHEALQQQELREGVDSDAEMQKLLLIEQAYAANARVIQTVDDMIKTLMGI